MILKNGLIMYNNYQWINKIDRRSNGEIWFQKGYEVYTKKGNPVLSCIDEFKINTPSFLQEHRFCVIIDVNGFCRTIDTNDHNDLFKQYLFMDNCGRIAFVQEVKIVMVFN